MPESTDIPADVPVEEKDEGDEGWRARLPSPVHPPTLAERGLYRFVRAALVGLSKLWFRLEVVDKDRMPASGPFVLAPVHRSNMRLTTAFSTCRFLTRWIRPPISAHRTLRSRRRATTFFGGHAVS